MKENNNKGFTLIEILVAIVALALVVVPLLQGFVTTAKLNAKSREKMMATNVAQTHMEQYSGLTIEEIDKEIKTLNGTYDPDVEFVESTDHKYSYSISGHSHNDKTYDIRLSVDASGYYASRVNAEGDTVDGINDTGFSQVTSIDVTQDGIYSEGSSVLDDALDEFFKRNQSSSDAMTKLIPGSENELKDELRRVITISVEDKNDSYGETYTDVNLQYEYKYVGSEYLGTGDNLFYTKNITIFSNQHEAPENRKDLRNVYLLYRPYYESPAGRDIIEINNLNNKHINVYLIKLNNNSINLQTLENNYKATVNLHENTGDANGSCIKIFSNLGYNMALEDNKETVEDERIVNDQVWYNYFWNAGSPSFDVNKIETDYFVPEYKEERMYRIKVEVYKDGAAGTGFKEEDKLAELSN